MLDVIVVIVSIIAVLAIGLYATWLFVHRVRAGESKGKSFREWLKNIFEAIWGL